MTKEKKTRITPELLRGMGACKGAIRSFSGFLAGRKYVYLTDRNLNLAIEYGLDVWWLLTRCRYFGLTPEPAGCFVELRGGFSPYMIFHPCGPGVSRDRHYVQIADLSKKARALTSSLRVSYSCTAAWVPGLKPWEIRA